MIDFLRFRKIYFVISALLLLPSLFSLAVWRFRPSIDFTGGSLLEVTTTAAAEDLRGALTEAGVEVLSVQSSGEAGVLLRAKEIDEAKKEEIITALTEKFPGLTVSRFETVGPILGRELLTKTLIAVLLAVLFILGYIAWQFKDKMYGVCAILAMFHDTTILLGVFSLLGHFFNVEVDTLFVTAVLTTLSLSVHDTVVVFNSIREQVGGRPLAGSDFGGIVNHAINATIVRSLNNSFTIMFMLTALVLLGGPTTRWFAVALLVGTTLGTYSSTFIASPLLTVWRRIFGKR